MAHGMRPAAAAFVTVVVVASAASSFVAFSRDRSATVAFWILAGGPTVLLAAVAAVWAKSEDYLWEWLAPKWGDFSRGLLGAAGLFGVAWAFARAVTPVGSPREIWLVSLYSQIGDPRVLQLHAPAVGAAIAVVALAEELLWRGTVTQLIAERMGSRSAWVWSAALYALVYVPTMWALRTGAGINPLLVVAALAGGLLWGGMARAFGRLAPSILAHALFDWTVLMMFPLWGAGAHG
jgi:membrane protease YdiL (CAAX protease family)